MSRIAKRVSIAAQPAQSMVRIALALALLAWTGIGVAVASVLLVRDHRVSCFSSQYHGPGNFSSFDFVV